MKSKTIKNLIVIGIVFAASFVFSNSVSAARYYDSDYTENFRFYDTGYGIYPVYHPEAEIYSGESYRNNSDQYNNYYEDPNSSNTSNSSYTSNSTSSNNSVKEDSSSEKSGSYLGSLFSSNSKSSDNLSDNEEDENSNLLGASSLDGVTALSLYGSHSFMPSSIWQWIFVSFLILVLIILFRIVMNNSDKKSH